MTEEKNQGQENQPANETQKPDQPAAETKKKGCGCFRKIALTIIIIVVAILLSIEFFGNKGIKMAVEKAASKVLNVAVTLEGVNLKPIAGSLELDNLAVANPEGFETKTLLNMGNAQVKLKTASLLSDTVEIEYIKLDGIDFTLEQKGLTSNLNTILKSLPKKSETDETDEEKETTSNGSQKKLLIKTLEITNLKVNAKILPIPGQVDVITLNIPDIKKTNIGGDGEEKIDTEALITKIIEWVSNAIAEAGTGVLPADLTGSLNSVLDNLNINDISGATMEEATQIIENATGVGTEAIDKTKEVTEGLQEGLKGLFNSKDK